MKDELISFRVAKLAKEKGFQEVCVNCYNEEGHLHTPQTSGSLLYHSNIIDDNSYSAPTQSLLQRSLREVHEIEVLVYCNASGWMWELNKTNGTHIKFSEYFGPNDAGQWDTYEEALDDGLYEALLLIK